MEDLTKKEQGEIDFIWIARKLIIEIHEQSDKSLLFGLKWGESKTGKDIYGINRKTQINGLNWADKNSKKALKILTN